MADVAVTFVGGVSKTASELETEFCEAESIFLNILLAINRDRVRLDEIFYAERQRNTTDLEAS